MAKAKNEIFSWADAWVFTSLYMTTKNGKKLDLPMLIGCCDMLNHSIVTVTELNQAFFKFESLGLIKFSNERIEYSSVAVKLIQTTENRRGGLFSRVDLTLKSLNSSRNGILVVSELMPRAAFTEEEIKEAYEQYSKKG